MGRVISGVKIAAVLVAVSLFAACEKRIDHAGKTLLVSIGDESFLYAEDLQKVLPYNLSPEDSADFAQKYIYNWISDALLYNKAERNVAADRAIQLLVEKYRRSLVLHAYQQKLMEQRLTAEISGTDIENYYNRNKELFVTEIPVLKGLFLKVPLTAPQLNKVRRWVKSKKQEDIDEMESYGLTHAVLYEYFYDRWVPLPEISVKMPLSEPELAKQTASRKNIEVNDTAFYYFLTVDSVLDKGSLKPIGFAWEEIKSVLLNLRQVEFMQKVKQDLYEQAVEDEKIKYYKD